MNLRDLSYLVALADHRNFRLAAEVCNISQPTLSGQIRRMEEELGTPLFERAPRNLIVTDAGKAAVRRARRILDEVRQMRDEAANLRETGLKRLHLGVFPTLAPYLLPHVVPKFTRAFPGVELLLTEAKSGALLTRLVDGGLDAALLTLPVDESHVTGRTLFREAFRLAVPAGHPLAERDTVGPADLAGQRLMLLEEGHCLRDQALALCRFSGAREHDDFRGTSLETLRQMVGAGVGVTLLPAMACRDRADDPVVTLPFPAGSFGREVGLFWRKTSAHVAVLDRLATLVEGVAARLV